MSDGRVVFSTELDNKNLEKELTKTKKEIAKIEETISSGEAKKGPLVQQAEAISQKMKEAREAVKRYSIEWSEGIMGADKNQAAAQERLRALQIQYQQITGEIDKVDKKLLPAYEKLDQMQQKAGNLQENINKAATGTGRMKDAAAEAEKRMDKFVDRVKALARRVFVFTIITSALRSLRDWMWKAIQTNDEAVDAVSRLKGALLTMAQPLVDVVIPAFTSLVDVLTRVVSTFAQIAAMIAGSTVDASKEAAKALNEQTEALEGAGKAAKDASKSFAGFDEINKLSDKSGSGGSESESIAPSFDFDASKSEEELQRILALVQAIAVGFLSWKIGSKLGLDLVEVLGVAMSIYFAIEFVKDMFDAWTNGVNLDNLTGMLLSAAGIAGGLAIAFGAVGAGIGLIVTGAAMLVTGIRDVITNGQNLENVLLIIAGIIATGLGIAVITGSWIPLLIAGIVAVITAIVAWQGNLAEFGEAFRQIFRGIIDFFTGVFAGDMELAWKGIKNIFIGAVNAIIIALESMVNAAVDGLNWLISKANNLSTSLGFSAFIPEIGKVHIPRIPYLAQGAVIPPNSEFLAVLGDQKSGTNIETPLATMVEAFRTALRDMGGSGGQSEAYLVVDEEVLGKVVYKLYNKEDRRVGVRLSES